MLKRVRLLHIVFIDHNEPALSLMQLFEAVQSIRQYASRESRLNTSEDISIAAR